MHDTLRKQLDQAFGGLPECGPELRRLLELVDETYQGHEVEAGAIRREQLLASQELLDVNRRMRSIMMALPDLYLHIDAAGVITECQGVAGSIAACPAWSLVGMALEDTVLAPACVAIRRCMRIVTRPGARTQMLGEFALGEHFYEGRLTACDNGGTILVLRDTTERRHALKVERYLQLLMTATLDALPLNLAILDGDGNIIATNRAWEQFAGSADTTMSRQERNDNYLDVCARSAAAGCADAAIVGNGLRQVLAGEREVFHYEYECVGYDAWYELRITHIAEECEGRVVVAHEDITARKKSEQALFDSEALLQSVLKLLPVGVRVADDSGTIIMVNREAERIWGAAAQSERGQEPCQLLGCWAESGRQVAPEEWPLTRALQEGRAVPEQSITITLPDGGKKVILCSAIPIRDQHGVVTAAIGVSHDVTERRHAEQALEQSERCMRAILAAAADGILGYDLDGRVAFANPASQRLLNREPGDLHGCTLAELFGTAAAAKLAHRDVELMQAKVDRGACGSITCECMGATLPEGGGVIGLRDITPRLALQSQLVQAQKFEAIGQLAAGVAHEINTPTQYIGDNVRFLRDAFTDVCELIAAVQALVSGAADPCLEPLRQLQQRIDVEFLRQECPQAINQTLDGVDRVSRIVYSMKDFAHPDRDDRAALDLNRVVTSTTTVCRNEWKYVSELVLELDEQLPQIIGFRSDLGQVVLNLVVNAAHAIAEVVGDGGNGKGCITVRTRSVGDQVELEVADTGVGIQEEHRARIFEQFFTTKAVGRGTGQGLALVRRIVVDKHGGAVKFDSEVGKGTVFTVRLPVHGRVEAGASTS